MGSGASRAVWALVPAPASAVTIRSVNGRPALGISALPSSTVNTVW
jgi:hypothetical protein